MRVRIRVYDLLPEGRLSWALNLVGTGVYHSSVELSFPSASDPSDSSPLEYAFGGHDQPGATGVFHIPAGSAAARMPGLRAYLTLDAGEAFGADWEATFGPRRRKGGKRRASSATSTSLPNLGRGGSEATLAGPPYGSWESGGSSSHHSLAESDGGETFGEEEGDDVDWDDGGESDGTQHLSPDERRAWRSIDRMRRDEDWMGTSYKLLGHNCNSFTDELVWRLTGRRAPTWLNRAAWVATSLPCIVPPGWIDEADEAAPDAPAPSSSATVGATVVTAPPRADQMEVGRRRA